MGVDPQEFGKLEGLLTGLVASFKEHKEVVEKRIEHMDNKIDKVHERLDDHMENEEADNDEQNERIAESNRKHAESNRRITKLDKNMAKVLGFIAKLEKAEDKVTFFWKNRYYIVIGVLGAIIIFAGVVMPAIASWIYQLSDGAVDLSILTYSHVPEI